MEPFRTGFGLLAAAIAVLVFPCAAAAEYLVPPSNSAATQYTEAFPTSGGNRNTEKAGEKDRSPGKALGDRNARRLEAQGATGRKAAEVAAATAPSVVAVANRAGQTAGRNGGGPKAVEPKGSTALVVEPEGSSPLGETIAQAAGISAAGGTGLLPPLAMLGAIAWALAFLWRRRQQSGP